MYLHLLKLIWFNNKHGERERDEKVLLKGKVTKPTQMSCISICSTVNDDEKVILETVWAKNKSDGDGRDYNPLYFFTVFLLRTNFIVLIFQKHDIFCT